MQSYLNWSQQFTHFTIFGPLNSPNYTPIRSLQIPLQISLRNSLDPNLLKARVKKAPLNQQVMLTTQVYVSPIASSDSR